jgi:DNA polymerase III gamma/tau subunit
MLSVAGSPERLLEVSDDELEALRRFAACSTPQHLLACLRLCLASEADITHSRAPRIALEMCLLELVYCRQAFPIDDVLERLGRLARDTAAVPPLARPAVERPGRRDTAIPAASAPAPGDQASDGLLAFIKSKSAPAASKLAQAAIAWTAENALTMTFPADSIFIEYFREADVQRQLRAWCQEYAGREVSVAIAASTEKKKPHAADDGRQQKRTREQQAMRNPVVQKIVETFNGKIIDIRTDR